VAQVCTTPARADVCAHTKLLLQLIMSEDVKQRVQM
jgi:hypothetical protein